MPQTLKLWKILTKSKKWCCPMAYYVFDDVDFEYQRTFSATPFVETDNCSKKT